MTGHIRIGVAENLCQYVNRHPVFNGKAGERMPRAMRCQHFIDIGDARQSYRSLGLLWHERKEYGAAVYFYQKALELNPKDAYTYERAGSAFFENKDAVNGELYYKKAIEIK